MGADRRARAGDLGFVDCREAEKNTLAEVLRRYQKDITPQKKSAAIESVKIDVLLRDKALVELALETGMRCGELLSLQ